MRPHGLTVILTDPYAEEFGPVVAITVYEPAIVGRNVAIVTPSCGEFGSTWISAPALGDDSTSKGRTSSTTVWLSWSLAVIVMTAVSPTLIKGVSVDSWNQRMRE